MSSTRFAAVVMAGGLSTRMKELKPLLPLGNTTVTDHVISVFRSAGTDVFLVVGYRREEIVSTINARDITVVINPDFKKGMFSSIQAGVRALPSKYTAFFVLPVDIPLVKSATIGQIMDAGSANPGKIIYPVYDGQRGHPPLIPSALVPGVLSWKGDGGLKAFLESHEELAFDLPVTDANILFDMDTQDEYKEMLRRFKDD